MLAATEAGRFSSRIRAPWDQLLEPWLDRMVRSPSWPKRKTFSTETCRYFGRLFFACGFPANWFRNPATGQRVSPDRPWTTMRFASPDYGDLKFILEPSRFLFVYPLARAYALSGEERFAEAFWSAAEDWARHNPPMSGPLWICGQESSLRILAWSFGLHAFIHAPATTPERVARIVSMIASHAWRTEQTLGYARSQRSNHLVSEAVGLWTAGTLYPELKDASAWRNVGAQLLREAVLDQITPEGAYLQDSFNYQRMVLHLLLWTLRLAEIHAIQLHRDIRERATAAFELQAASLDPRLWMGSQSRLQRWQPCSAARALRLRRLSSPAAT